MRLLEFESKKVFQQFEIPLANHVVILKGENIEEKINKFAFPAIIKSQIAIGSRKKEGLIKIAQSREEGLRLVTEFLEREVGGYKVEAVLIEELVEIQKEYYCSIALDASGRRFFIIASAEGGIDIEEVSKSNPEVIIKKDFSLKEGLSKELAQNVGLKLGFRSDYLNSIIDIFLKLWKITIELEAQLVEINPLVLTSAGLVAVDGKMILDDDSVFRQPIIKELQERKFSELERNAQQAGFSFVELDGDIGILSNGAGLTMALLDVLSNLGLKPANFLDVGGGASKERVYKALELLFKLEPKLILINIFGGITRCDIVAEAIIQALKDFTNIPPLVIRLTGTKDKEGISILKNEGILAYKDVMEAVNKIKEVLG